MAIEVMLVKGQDGSLRPASAADQEHMSKFKTGQALLVHKSGSNQKKGPVSISQAMAMMQLEHKEQE